MATSRRKVELFRVGCGRRLQRARYDLAQGEAALARTFYAEIMQVVEDGRVSLEAAKTAFELCLQEVDDREDQLAEGAEWTMGKRRTGRK